MPADTSCELDHNCTSEIAYSSVEELKKVSPNQTLPFDGLFILFKKSKRTASNGSEFTSLSLGDQTGRFTINCFGDNPINNVVDTLKEGAVVHLTGRTGFYRDQFSPKLIEIRDCEPETLSDEVIERLVKVAPEDADALWSELESFRDSINDSSLRQTVVFAMEELGQAFKQAPGAISMHHAYRFGLIEHTVHILRCARVLLPLYPEIHADLALAGIILHDVGKVIEYEGQFSYQKSREGRLYGHVVLGYRLARKAGIRAKLSQDHLERLEHIILSHQGELEWGAAVLPSTPEAVFVSQVDNLDAKMGMVQEALRQSSQTREEFSDYLPGLKTKILVAPVEGVIES